MERRDLLLALAYFSFVGCKDLSPAESHAKMAADNDKKITEKDVSLVIETRLAEKNVDYAVVLEAKPSILERQPDIAQKIREGTKNPGFISLLEKFRIEGLHRLKKIDLDPAVKMLLLDLQLEKVLHEVATTLDHFLGVFELMREWGHKDEAAYTGLFHAIYGTEFNPVQVLNHKLESDREILRKRVGKKGEQGIYFYATVNSDELIADVSSQKKPATSIKHFQTKTLMQLKDNDFVILADSQIANSFEPYIALNKDVTMLKRLPRYEPLRPYLSKGGQKALDLAKLAAK